MTGVTQSPLFGSGLAWSSFFKMKLHDPQIWASSEFSIPHFGQFNRILPLFLDIANEKASFRLDLFFL